MNIVKGAENSLLHRTYVQKSRIFLLPLSGVRRDSIFRPINTYVSSPDLLSETYPFGINPTDYILIINFPRLYKDREEKLKRVKDRKAKYTQEVGRTWEYFEMENILSNPLYLHTHETEDEFIYTFDLSDWKFDWDNFLKGRYSKLSQTAKDRILRYRWNDLKNNERNKMHCYLYPMKPECLTAFATELQVPIEDLKEVKELCSKPNMKLETMNCEGLLNKEKSEEKTQENQTEPTE